jgi:hypothetical protein
MIAHIHARRHGLVLILDDGVVSPISPQGQSFI